MTSQDRMRRIMAGTDLWAWPVRAVLLLCSLIYTGIINARNKRYDRGSGIFRARVPVISIGNITTGGTGKTPLVIEIARRLESRGQKVAILSRGYKAATAHLGDELQLIARRLPGVVCIQDADRSAGAEEAVNTHNVNAIVLDDGFQHRRLGRDLDVVAVDATRPFGYGFVLPRGLLREPVRSLRRADLLIITRCDLLQADELQHLEERLATEAPDVPRIRCDHRALDFCSLDGSPLDNAANFRDQKVLCLSGVGNPASFEQSVGRLGAEVRYHLVFADHHHYAEAHLRRAAALAKKYNCEAVVTTEKDAVKLSTLAFDWPCPVLVMPIEIRFHDDGGTILDRALDRLLNAGN